MCLPIITVVIRNAAVAAPKRTDQRVVDLDVCSSPADVSDMVRRFGAAAARTHLSRTHTSFMIGNADVAAPFFVWMET